jgi:glutamine---fructose-6-phosphate transaminase (isomerizing)
MCGIIGLIHLMKNQKTSQLILDGLIQLQNRGYDSAGIGLLYNSELIIKKFASTNQTTALAKLQEMCNTNSNLDSNIGIGHNRWATHGPKTDINSHPHVSSCGNFMLVHNGIIENYQKIKNFLCQNEYEFISQTDTEVIVNLISFYYKQTKRTFEAVKLTIADLEGTYGIVLINRLDPNTIYCVRNGSPLLVGLSEQYAIISSEQSGFCNMVNTYITLKNDDICQININNDTSKIEMKTYHKYDQKQLTIGKYDLTPEPFEHWTLKEIHEQSTTILNAINNGGRIKSNSEVILGGLDTKIKELKEINNLILLGCGTSYFAGLHSVRFFKSLCNFNVVQVFDGADFDISDVPKIGKTALVLISQSGETKDLHRCVSIAKESNIITIGIINVVDSLIAREVDCGIYLNAGREMAVASTKAFTSQTICLSLLAIWFSQIHNINQSKRQQFITDLQNLSNDVSNCIEKTLTHMDKLAKYIVESDFNNMFVLGKGSDEAIAKEGSLKIKEISYIHAEGYSASSLKHGPFALLDKNLPVVLLNCDLQHSTKIFNCYEEIKSRNAPIIFVLPDKQLEYLKQLRQQTDFDIIIPENSTFQSLLGVIPMQELAYFLSVRKNINPDIPKNLAKVVTVE